VRYVWFLFVGLAHCVLGGAVEDFLAAAKTRHGEAGAAAAQYLVEHMPPKDRESLSAEFLTTNLDLAFQARAEFPWAKQVPEDVFRNDVLPYAVFDETREAWRPEYLELARGLVKDARTATEAAQALNRQLFKVINVHYNTGRKRPNQSPKESKELGKATCTGLSIILVDACRAVGIPARAVGTPLWANERGNHTWVEIWDGDWHFTGADEYDANGLDRGWFVGDAGQAKADVPRHAIYATSWKRAGLAFPMVWAKGSEEVAAVNVTARYAKADGTDPNLARLGVRLWDRRGGTRLSAKVCVLDGVRRTCALADTKAGTADLNDMPRFSLTPGTQGWLRFTVAGEVREMPYAKLAKGDVTVDAHWSELTVVSPAIVALEAWIALPVAERKADAPALQTALSEAEANRALELLTADRMSRLAEERRAELEAKQFQIGDKSLRWLEKTFGTAPAGGHSLWISMHGGGSAPPAVNNQQWTNQIRLYEPAEGIYVAPRGPTDTWNLWHEAHVDGLFQRLIDDYVAVRGVNPDRVYLMGYSAGGDGVWQLAPRMADRYAAAAMMAGHPNEASLLGLRNLPFAIFMGGKDAAYNRNRIAGEKGAELDRLGTEDPGGYIHFVRIYEGLGHWMNRRDAEAVPWMSVFRREPWPRRIVWQQDDVVHTRFYWLQVADRSAVKDRQKIVATLKDRTVVIEGESTDGLSLRLSDRLLDLDSPVKVTVNGREVFAGKAVRKAGVIAASLEERADPASAATAEVRW
jgi:poly(3-hydroxybutyrate) depolymerase